MKIMVLKPRLEPIRNPTWVHMSNPKITDRKLYRIPCEISHANKGNHTGSYLGSLINGFLTVSFLNSMIMIGCPSEYFQY